MIIVVKQPGSYNLQQVKSVPLRALSSVKKILLSLNNLKVCMFFATFAKPSKISNFFGNMLIFTTFFIVLSVEDS